MIHQGLSSTAIDESDSMVRYSHSTSSDICTGDIVPRKNMGSMMTLWNTRKNSKKKRILVSDHSTRYQMILVRCYSDTVSNDSLSMSSHNSTTYSDEICHSYDLDLISHVS